VHDSQIVIEPEEKECPCNNRVLITQPEGEFMGATAVGGKMITVEKHFLKFLHTVASA
jgi:hypothetical protein